jgi:hypothetical protein
VVIERGHKDECKLYGLNWKLAYSLSIKNKNLNRISSGNQLWMKQSETQRGLYK